MCDEGSNQEIAFRLGPRKGAELRRANAPEFGLDVFQAN
jgi:hypothetical protein